MKPSTGLIIFAGLFVTLLGGIGIFNYVVDPQCYYGCNTIDPQRRTLNTYYQVAQRIVAHPEAEAVILGSSRGENTPPLWVESVTGLKTLNLSASGAELATKLTFVKIAEENTKIKKVIWLADYFELITENADAKIKNTPVLRKYLKGDVVSEKGLRQSVHDVLGLIDHNLLEASLYFLKNKDATAITQGAGSHIDYSACESASYPGKETEESLKKEVDLLYQSYSTRVLVPPQSEKAWEEFKGEMQRLAAKNIEVNIVVTPYHPAFLRRLQKEHPKMYQAHYQWISKLQGLSGQGIKVFNYFDGMSGTEETPSYWNDGVHFTCRYSMMLLKEVIHNWPAEKSL